MSDSIICQNKDRKSIFNATVKKFLTVHNTMLYGIEKCDISQAIVYPTIRNFLIVEKAIKAIEAKNE